MTDYKPQELTAITTVDNTDVFQIETAIATTPVSKYITGASLRAQVINFQSAPITSTSWDGDARSTTAKTVIDLSAVFSGVPAGIRAVLVEVSVRDSASAANDCYLILSPNDTAGQGQTFRCSGVANDSYVSGGRLVPCNVDGDIYFQVLASGASTLDAVLQVWGWVL